MLLKIPPAFDPRTLEAIDMDTNQFLLTLDDVFQLPPGTTRMEDVLRDVAEFSSLTTIVLLAAIDEDFDVTMAPDELASCITVDDLVSIVRTERSRLKKVA